jgi:hypothetical protein
MSNGALHIVRSFVIIRAAPEKKQKQKKSLEPLLY